MKIRINTPVECSLCKAIHNVLIFIDIDFGRIKAIEQVVMGEFGEVGIIRQYGEFNDRSEFICRDCLMSKNSLIKYKD